MRVFEGRAESSKQCWPVLGIWPNPGSGSFLITRPKSVITTRISGSTQDQACHSSGPGQDPTSRSGPECDLRKAKVD
jgi:hypothetical protein